MKTLDEVIRAIDYCMFTSDCSPCSYKEVKDCAREKMKDALHYLQDYRMLVNDFAEKRQELEDEKARYQEAVRNCEEAENKYRKAEQDALKALDDWASRPIEENKKLVLTVDNSPLAWQELKAMEGKPVWVEALLYKQWAIIAYVGDEHIRFEGANLYAPESRVYMGDANGWQAYRKER